MHARRTFFLFRSRLTKFQALPQPNFKCQHDTVNHILLTGSSSFERYYSTQKRTNNTFKAHLLSEEGLTSFPFFF